MSLQYLDKYSLDGVLSRGGQSGVQVVTSSLKLNSEPVCRSDIVQKHKSIVKRRSPIRKEF